MLGQSGVGDVLNFAFSNFRYLQQDLISPVFRHRWPASPNWSPELRHRAIGHGLTLAVNRRGIEQIPI